MTGQQPENLPSPSTHGDVARLIGGSAFIFACRVGGAALTFASQVLMARWMGAAEFGAYLIAFSWCILLSTVATAGIPMAAIRFIGAGLAKADGAYIRGFIHSGGRVVLVGGTLIAIVGGAIILGAGRLLPEEYRLPMLLALAAVPFFALLNFYGGVANSFSWLMQNFLPTNVLRPLIFLAMIWAVAHQGQQLSAIQAMQVQWVAIAIITVIAALALERRVRVAAPLAGRKYETRLWIRTALPLLGVVIFTGYLPEITVVLVGFFLPSADVAVFQVSYRIALLIAFGLYAVDAFTAPEAARLIAETNHNTLQRVVNRATRLRFWPAVGAVAVMAVAGRPLLGLFGAEFVAGYPVLLILAAAQLAPAAVGPVTRLMSVSGHQDRCLVVSLGSLVALVLLIAVLVPRFGTTGAAVAALIDMALWSLWMRYLIVRSLDIRPSIF